MAIIYSYPTATPVGSDTMIGTQQAVDESGDNLTVTFTVASIANFTKESIFPTPGTVGYLPVFSGGRALADSPIFVDSFGSPTVTTVGTNLTIAGGSSISNDLTVGGQTLTDTLEVTTSAEIQGELSMGNVINMGGSLINNVSDPVDPQDAATKAYVDAGDVESKFAITLRQPARFTVAVQPGDPVYITGYNVGQGRYEVDLAQAGDPARMPAIGVAADTYGTNDNGYIITHGAAEGINTNAFDVGDTVWIAQAGGLTNVRPSGTNLVQNVGVVGKKSGGAGEIEAIALGRTNDVPNIPRGSIWVGDVNGVANPLPIGTTGQILVSDGTDVNWQDDDYIDGSGTVNTISLFTGAATIGDSAIKQHDGNNITIGANVGTATGANYTLSVGNNNNVSSGTARVLAVGANNATTGTPVDSTVIGIDNSANSSYSLTVGQNNQTNSGTSFVAGIDNITSSNVPRQFVIGRANNVDSVDTIVLGDRNTVAETGAGFGSMMVFGHLNNVLGDRILCLGTFNTINSDNQGAYIIGVNSSSTADRTYSVGQQNAITGNESYAFGKSNTIAAAASAAVGTNNSISAVEKAYAFGFGNDNINFKSFAIGDNNDVLSTQRTYLIGRENKPATDNTIILGQFSDPTVLRTNNTNGRSTVAFAVGSNNGARRTAWEFRGKQTSTGGTSAGDSMQIMAWALLYSTSYADDTAAAAGGVEVGQLYRTGSTVKIRMT